MLSNKEAGMVEPSNETLDNIENIKNMKTLAEKIEQIGCETQGLFTNAFMGNISSKSKDELDQIFGDIWYYMNYLRTLTRECPEPIKYGLRLVTNKKSNNNEPITQISDTVPNKQPPIKTMDDAIETLSNWNDKLLTLINEILDDPTDDLVSTPKPDVSPDTGKEGENV